MNYMDVKLISSDDLPTRTGLHVTAADDDSCKPKGE